MTDNKRLRGEPRPDSRVPGSEPYEVEYFATKHGISTDQAKEIIRQAGVMTAPRRTSSPAKASAAYGGLIKPLAFPPSTF